MTIKEIAEALNVSISAVSKALNDASDIADETKNRIIEYATEAGYHLKRKRSRGAFARCTRELTPTRATTF